MDIRAIPSVFVLLLLQACGVASRPAVADAAAVCPPAGCVTDAKPSDPCEGIDCGGHGRCLLADGQPGCDCDPGYRPEGPAPSCTLIELAVDRCDEDPLAEVAFQSHRAGSFRVFFLPGTAAEKDLQTIVDLRQQALETISTALKITEERTIELDLTPNRLAAAAHDVRAGMAIPWMAWIMALYLPQPETYERERYGHELMHVLAHHLDPDHRYHFKLVNEGLAEIFDGSNRDQHFEHVMATRAYHDFSIEHAVSLNDADVFVPSYAKAGSFVQLLLESDPSPDRLKAFYRGCRQQWQGDDPLTMAGELLDGGQLEQILDAQLRAHYAIDLTTFRQRWTDALAPHWQAPVRQPPAADRAAIEALLAVRDAALTIGDAALYRSTMEGFACDRTSDAQRLAFARQMVGDPRPTKSTIVDLFDLGLKNYAHAIVVFDREREGETIRLRAEVERYPAGWRFNWVDDELAQRSE